VLAVDAAAAGRLVDAEVGADGGLLGRGEPAPLLLDFSGR
jgi:hypothetical protein